MKELIIQSEKKGTAGVRPHSALLKGELLDRIQVSNNITYAKDAPRRFEMALYSNTTVWELKKKIAQHTNVTAEYVKLVKCAGVTELKETEHGKTLQELRLKPNEVLSASKRSMSNIPKAPITTSTGQITPEARRVFDDWFDKFQHGGFMTPQNCADFIRSCTDDNCKADDPRILNLFHQYDYDKDGKIDRAGFHEFYRIAAVSKPEVVRANMAAHHYRNDLKKITEIDEENKDPEKLPRYKIAHNPEYFDLLFRLLDRKDESSEEAWNLIQ